MPNEETKLNEENHLIQNYIDDHMDGGELPTETSIANNASLNKISERLLILKEQLNNGVFPFKFAAAVSLTNLTTETLLDNETFESDLAAQTLGVLAGLPAFITADILSQVISYLITKHYRKKHNINDEMIEAAQGKLNGFIQTKPTDFIKNLAKFLTIGASTFELLTIVLSGLPLTYDTSEQYAALALVAPAGAIGLTGAVKQWGVNIDNISAIQLGLAFAGLGTAVLSIDSISEFLAGYLSTSVTETIAPAVMGGLTAALVSAPQTFGQVLNYRHNIKREANEPRATITSNISSFFSGCKKTATKLANTVGSTSYNPFTRGA